MEYHLTVLQPFARDLAYYASVRTEESDTPAEEGPTIHGAIRLWQYGIWPRTRLDTPRPLTPDETRRLTTAFRTVPPLLQQARRNLAGSTARDLWVGGIRAFEEQSEALAQLQEHGMANLELNVPVEPHMVFRLGSITKQFTAVSILMLMEQDKLNLNDDLTRFLPDYPTGGRTITIEHLLTHTSGMKSYTDRAEWLPLWLNDMSVEEVIDISKNQPFEFEPGENFKYCNSGYILLGAIIEKISGLKYAEFVQKYIFEPLGMTHSLYDDTKRLVPGRVSGYSKDKRRDSVATTSTRQEPPR